MQNVKLNLCKKSFFLHRMHYRLALKFAFFGGGGVKQFIFTSSEYVLLCSSSDCCFICSRILVMCKDQIW